MTIRTRFAPSPTGMLHIGGARTALFAWLYAKHLGGEFVLRIEDTDRQRSTDEATQVILDGLRWLGLDWDGEPVFQRQREDKHRAAVQKLLDMGLAYRCHCSKETVDLMREEQRIRGEKPRYDGRCRQQQVSADEAHVVRFRSPDEGLTIVHDLVLGDVTFENNELDDLIIMRSDGSPTYNLAVVIDDADMNISHVIRGSDHLNNTPRQIQLYQALGLKVPQFAHIPLIHGPDGAKMSKRHGAVAITEYKENGYLADAVNNYLARLGWSHGDDEVFSRQQLIELFDLKQVGKAASRFDQSKLDWLNQHYLHHSPAASLVDAVQSRLQAQGIEFSQGAALVSVIELLQERSKNLNDLVAGCVMFYAAPSAYEEKAVRKHLKETAWPLLESFIQQAEALEAWQAEPIHDVLKTVCEQHECKLGKLAQPIRIMLSGKAVSPPIDASLAVLGKAESLRRLHKGLQALKPNA